MKNILLFIIGLTFSLQTIAQINSASSYTNPSIIKEQTASFNSMFIIPVSKNKQNRISRDMSAAQMGLDSMVITQLDNITHQLVKDTKSNYHYTTQGYLKKQVDFEWDMANQKWIPKTIEEFTYDNLGYVTSHTKQKSKPDYSIYYGLIKVEYVNDANGNPTITTNYKWNYNSNQWEYDLKTDVTYNINGLETKVLYSRWNSGSST